MLLTACSSYIPSESITDDERAYVEKAITSLFEGAEKAKPYLTEEYYNELTEEGYWGEIKRYGLVKLEVTTADELSDGIMVRCWITYRDTITGKEDEKEEEVDFKLQDGKFLINRA